MTENILQQDSPLVILIDLYKIQCVLSAYNVSVKQAEGKKSLQTTNKVLELCIFRTQHIFYAAVHRMCPIWITLWKKQFLKPQFTNNRREFNLYSLPSTMKNLKSLQSSPKIQCSHAWQKEGLLSYFFQAFCKVPKV